ncbi:fibronectin type III domain-containing protein [Pseudomonas sp. MHK4]
MEPSEQKGPVMNLLLPQKPGYLVITSITSDSMNVAWSYTTQFTRFEVTYGRDDQWPTPIDTKHTTSRNYRITGLQPQTKYFIEVRAENASGLSAPSEGTATTQAGVVKPVAPTGFSAQPTKDTVALTWQKSALAAGYRVSYGLLPNGPVINTFTTTVEAYTVSGLSSGTAYYFDLVAFNAAGDSPSVRATASTLAVPAAPTNLKATPAILSMDLSWTGSAGAIEYVIRHGVEPGGASQTQTTRITSHTLTGLAKNTLYFVEVSAVNVNGESLPARITARTQDGPPIPSTPGPLHTLVTPHSIRVTWAASPAPEYRVSHGLDNGEHVVIGSEKTQHLTYVVQGLQPQTGYFVEVRGVNSTGESAPSSATATTAIFEAPRSLTPGELTDESAAWRWSAGADYPNGTRYEVSLGDQVLDTVGDTQYLVKGLTENTQYVFKVRAKGPGGYFSNYVSDSFTIKPYRGIRICSPGGLRGGRSTATTALLSWEEPYATCPLCPDAVDYEISGEGIATLNVIRPPCEVTGLKADSEYYLAVRAKGGGNNVSEPSHVLIAMQRGKPGSL